MTLRKKLVLSFVLLSFILGTVIGYFSYQNAKELVMQSKEREMVDTINRIDISMNSWVKQVTMLAENIKENAIAAQLLSNEGNPADPEVKYLNEWMENLLRLVEGCSDVLLMNTDGEVYYCYSDSCLNEEKSAAERIGYIDSARIEQCISSEKNQQEMMRWIGIGNSICQAEEEKIVSLVSVMETKGADQKTDASQGILGYVVIELNPKQFSALMLNNHSMFQNQYTFIMDDTGKIITSNKNITYDWLSKVTENMNSGSRRYQFEWEGERYFACKQYNGLTGWETYSVVSEEDFFPQAIRLRRGIFYTVLFAMLAAVLGVYILSYTFTKPVKILSGAMKRVENGDFEVQVATDKKDEMGQLIRAFNYMVREIRNLINVVYQQKLAQKNAELIALQAQINPHFLYNTLDAINWMLIEKDEMEISDIVVSLGDILRYSLQDNEELVTFREELHYIESYLCIQKSRLESRLQTELEIEDEALGYQVPKLILQPIVENAVRHGIERTKEGGQIRITAKLKENINSSAHGKELWITVSDNGPGMSSEELNRCKEQIFGCRESDKTGKRQSIGMRNVYRRIQLLFGADNGMLIESKENAGTKVTLILPEKTVLKINEKEAGADENINR